MYGHNYRLLGRDKDVTELMHRQLISMAEFLAIGDCVPYLEILRRAEKRQSKKLVGKQDQVVLDALKRMVNIHYMIRNG